MNKEEAIRIFRKEIECLSHAKCEDCILEKVCDPAKTTPLDSEYIEAYGMAIQALSQEPICDRDCEHCTWTECPIEPCDDTISRQAYADWLDWLCRLRSEINSGMDMARVPQGHRDKYIDVLTEVIDNLPSVTQKCEKCAMNGSSSKYCDNCKSSRHKGHWIPIYQGDEIINYHCSECELGDTNGSINLYGWDYCRRCGAEMESEQNE